MPPPPHGLSLFHFCKKTVRGRGQASPRSDQREVPSRQDQFLARSWWWVGVKGLRRPGDRGSGRVKKLRPPQPSI